MTAIAKIASPIVWVLNVSGQAVLKAFGHKSKSEDRVTNEEIRRLIAEAERTGVIEPGERATITGVLRLGDQPVRAVMTPPRDVEMINVSEGLEQVRRRIMQSVHSGFPVYDRSPDEMLGVLQVKDVPSDGDDRRSTIWAMSATSRPPLSCVSRQVLLAR